MDTVLKLLDELEAVIDQSKHMPFSNKIQVEKEDLFEIITEIRLRLPNELKQAKWILEERNKILIDAQNEAEEIQKAAEDRLKKMVDENEITKRAYDQATEIIEASKRNSKEMRLGANEYADEILSITENKLREMMEIVHNETMKIDQFFNESINIIYENRQELKGTASKRMAQQNENR